jgi:hypothetical protein
MTEAPQPWRLLEALGHRLEVGINSGSDFGLFDGFGRRLWKIV